MFIAETEEKAGNQKRGATFRQMTEDMYNSVGTLILIWESGPVMAAVSKSGLLSSFSKSVSASVFCMLCALLVLLLLCCAYLCLNMLN